MKIRCLSVVLILVISCAALLYGCGNSSSEEQTTAQTDSIQDTTAQVTSEAEVSKVYEYNIEELWCKSDDNNIYGQMYIPQGENNQKFPTVIIAHGFSGTYKSNIPYAETFAKNGIAAYLFDFCGGSYNSRSDGKTTEMSIITEKKDLLSVFDQIEGFDYVDTDNIFIMGESQGGIVATLCASELLDRVRGLTLLYPAYSIPDMLNEMFPDADSVPEKYEIWGMEIGRVYYDDCLTFDAFDAISQYKGPVIIYHGTDDKIVPFLYSERAIETFENAKLIEEKGVGHGFENELEYSTAEDMTEFIKANLA